MTGAVGISAGRQPWRVEQAERYLRGLELFGMHFGLARMRALMAELGRPNEHFASIHVVGTNGKSSTTRMIAALLDRHGLVAGAYTSPHLISFAERVQVAGRDVGPEHFAAAVAQAARAAGILDARRTDGDDDRVTQFEALTAAAYVELAAAGVGVAVVEAGLGGRFDATNVIDSKVAVLTNVGLEHTRWLGPTIADIAAEKLDVVRPGGVLVLGADLHPDAADLARRVADERGARIVRAPAEVPGVGPMRARGAFQRRNLAVAATAASAFLERPLDPEALRSVAAELVIPGRFQVLDPPVPGDPGASTTLLDGAHNPDGARALAESLPEFLAGRSLCLVLAILEDKNAAAMLAELMPLCSRLICTAAPSPRSLEPDALAALAALTGIGPPAEVEPDPGQALALARSAPGVVLATGSLHLVGELLRRARAGSP